MLGVALQVRWGAACSTKSLQLADWFSRFLAELDDLPTYGVKVDDLAGIRFDLRNLLMTLPDGRRSIIRCKGPPHRAKLGFNFPDFFRSLQEVRRKLPKLDQGSKRKVR